MNYKIEGAIKRNKSKFIICAVLWLILVIVLVAPLAYSSFQVKQGASLEIFIETFVNGITNPFVTFTKVFLNQHQKMNIQILSMVLVIGVKEENNIEF